MRGKKLFWFVPVTLALLAAVEIWERPISGIYFEGIIPLRLCLSGGESRSVTVSGYRVHYDVLGPAAGPRYCWCMVLAGAQKGGWNLRTICQGRLPRLSSRATRLRPQRKAC